MAKLSYQDSAFLKLESSRRPYHVGGLMILKLPEPTPRGYLRRLARHCGRLNEMWPILNKQLSDPEDLSRAQWIPASNYNPAQHVHHYALPAPGKQADLLQLVTSAHERTLDRSRPLWEIHLIEGLQGGQFALYCKVHHALIDGVGALRMVDALFSTSPTRRLRLEQAIPTAREHDAKVAIARQLRGLVEGVKKQYTALPELLTLFAHMGRDTLSGKTETMTLPFTAPRSIFNGEVDSSRCAAICDLPLNRVRSIGRRTGGTVNDVLLAVCGGALRAYLMDQGALPRKSLVAGLPVSLKSSDDTEGNQLSFILCPFFTDESNPKRRLERIVRSTKKAKSELTGISTTASQEFANMMLMPTVLLTLSGNATRVSPAVNAIFSNVPGSREKLYLDGAELQAMYPLSVVTDGMGINLTVISYLNKLSFAITSCPTGQPGIERLDEYLKNSFRELANAMQTD